MSFIKDNKAAASLDILTIDVALFLGNASGSDLRKSVDLEVPAQVRAALDGVSDPAKPAPEYSLADADRIASEWEAFVRTGTAQLEASISDAQERHAVLASVVDLGVVAVNEVAPTLPGGAFLVGGLSLLTGLFLKRPGEDKRVAKEKEDSYNAGMKKAEQLVVDLVKKATSSDEPKA